MASDLFPTEEFPESRVVNHVRAPGWWQPEWTEPLCSAVDSCQEPPQLPRDEPVSQADQRLTLNQGLRAVVFLLSYHPGHKFILELKLWCGQRGGQGLRELWEGM